MKYKKIDFVLMLGDIEKTRILVISKSGIF